MPRNSGSVIGGAGGGLAANVTTGIWTMNQVVTKKATNNWPSSQPFNQYQISRSLRFNSADSAYLNRTPASSSDRQKFTWSAWVKRSQLGVAQFLFGQAASSSSACDIRFAVDDNFGFVDESISLAVATTQVFRDVSAWYHVMVAVDTTQATASNRVKLYVNGLQITALASTSYPSQNANTQFNTTNQAVLGTRSGGATSYFNGYMTEINFIDGYALDPSYFGVTDTATGVWVPKAFDGTYGTNGFYLNFSDNSNTTAATLGKDNSGNGNNWTPNNFSVTAGVGNDSLVDTPTPYGTDTGAGGEVRGNYCTLNPLQSTTVTLSNGNLDFTATGAAATVVGSMAIPSSDKWYFEFTPTVVPASTSHHIGVQATNTLGYSEDLRVILRSDGNVYNESGLITTITGYTTNDVIGVALNSDAGTIQFYKNGSTIGSAFTVTNLSSDTNNYKAYNLFDNTAAGNFNFGQRPFAYTAPSGFKALCTQNLPEPTIGATSTEQARNYFNVVARTFTAATASISGLGFSPDWLWFKRRNAAASHSLYDRLRGTNARLISNDTLAEITTTSAELTSFDSDGFTVGADPGSISINAANNDTGVVWCWRANGAGSLNNAGSIQSTVSASTLSGFSIVTFTTPASFTNATVGHGLGAAPAMIITKSRGSTSNWETWHTGLTSTQYLRLNTTAAAATDSTVFNGTSSTTFTLGSNTWWGSGNYLAYCFAPVAGYSAFGSFVANAASNGPFIYTGFRPAFVLIKRSSVVGAPWSIVDAKRNTYNAVTLELDANLSDAEFSAGSGIDFVSNGFKIRDASNFNTNLGNTFIYAAFAEFPFKYAVAR